MQGPFSTRLISATFTETAPGRCDLHASRMRSETAAGPTSARLAAYILERDGLDPDG